MFDENVAQKAENRFHSVEKVADKVSDTMSEVTTPPVDGLEASNVVPLFGARKTPPQSTRTQARDIAGAVIVTLTRDEMERLQASAAMHGKTLDINASVPQHHAGINSVKDVSAQTSEVDILTSVRALIEKQTNGAHPETPAPVTPISPGPAAPSRKRGFVKWGRVSVLKAFQ